jgi:hypothetical protein
LLSPVYLIAEGLFMLIVTISLLLGPIYLGAEMVVFFYGVTLGGVEGLACFSSFSG